VQLWLIRLSSDICCYSYDKLCYLSTQIRKKTCQLIAVTLSTADKVVDCGSVFPPCRCVVCRVSD